MRPGEPPTEESSEKLFMISFSRVDSSVDNLDFYSNNSKKDKVITVSKDSVEQEGVWLLKMEKEWSLVAVGTLARQTSLPNLWVHNNDIVKLKSEKYDLSSVGRVKLNSRIGSEVEEAYGELNRDDILSVIDIIVNLKDGIGDYDDIDHLGNRRVRSVGELVENQFRTGLVRMERAIKERMGSVPEEKLVPKELINAKPLTSILKEFFGSSQLSQFMDQTNPLSEITTKKKIVCSRTRWFNKRKSWF